MVVFKMPGAAGSRGQKQKRIPFLKNEPEKLLKTNVWLPKTNPNEPKNEAGKLLKKRSCGKNEPKTNPAILLKINDGQKTNPKRTGEISATM